MPPRGDREHEYSVNQFSYHCSSFLYYQGKKTLIERVTMGFLRQLLSLGRRGGVSRSSLNVLQMLRRPHDWFANILKQKPIFTGLTVKYNFDFHEKSMFPTDWCSINSTIVIHSPLTQ